MVNQGLRKCWILTLPCDSSKCCIDWIYLLYAHCLSIFKDFVCCLKTKRYLWYWIGFRNLQNVFIYLIPLPRNLKLYSLVLVKPQNITKKLIGKINLPWYNNIIYATITEPLDPKDQQISSSVFRFLLSSWQPMLRLVWTHLLLKDSRSKTICSK